MTVTTRYHAPEPVPPSNFRDAQALAELFVGVFRRDLQAFFPRARFEADPARPSPGDLRLGPRFRVIPAGDPRGDHDGDEIELFGCRYGVGPCRGGAFSPHELRMVGAIGAVASLRYHLMFQAGASPRMDLFRGGSDDHYVAAFIEPSTYSLSTSRPCRIASTIQTLRTAALSTYENRRVSTGALLLGSTGATMATSPEALAYGVELTALKSVHRLCDGGRTLFLVDREGRLAEVIDVRRWAANVPPREPSGDQADAGGEVPFATSYTAHARATRSGGHVCLVLSPNQEIKVFSEGAQVFSFAHGRWRILDAASKYAVWREAVANEPLARSLYQTALDLSEARQGGLFVVVEDPCEAVGRLVAPQDALDEIAPRDPLETFNPGDPLAKRALHYLARGRAIATLDSSVLEALATLDGAVVADRAGRLIAFGAILRHDASLLPAPITAEGARTTAALIASRFGPVLKVSEDGVVSCFLRGARAWEL
ncbi:MAG: hypothetical protein AB7I30_14570 [Isosphaeraceae bacterium]